MFPPQLAALGISGAIQSTVAGDGFALFCSEPAVLKTFALAVALALGQNAAFMCLANCDTTVLRSAGCHQSAGARAVESSINCVEAPVVVATIADGSAKTQLPVSASSVAYTPRAGTPAVSLQATFLRGEVAAPAGVRSLPLRI